MTKCTPEEARGLAEQSDWCFCGYCQNIAPLHRIARLIDLAREPMAARLEVLEREHTEFFDRWHDERRKREALELERDALAAQVAELREAMEEAAALCELKIERPAGFGGRFEGYGSFMDSLSGNECAVLIRARIPG